MKRSHDLALLASGVAPAIWATSRLSLTPDAAHALGAIRVLGPGSSGILRALDVVWTSLFLALPIGTRTFRAELASVCALALFGVVLFCIARKILETMHERSIVTSGLACVGSLLATLALPMQMEASAPAGSMLGATLALGAFALLPDHLFLGLACLGLSATYEVDVLAVALPSLILLRRLPRSLGALVGIAPLLLVFLRSPSAVTITRRLLSSPLGEGTTAHVDLASFAMTELGPVVIALAIAGFVIGLVKRQRLAIALALATCIGLALARIGAPAGPSRFAPSVIAALGCACALSAIAIMQVATWIARIPVPYARASSVMVLVLAAALPFKTADDTSLRSVERDTSGWVVETILPIAPHALVVMPLPNVAEVLVSMRAAGEMGNDVVLFLPHDVQGRMATRAILRDPVLAPLARDLVLFGAPQEYALTNVAQTRPVLLAYDPRWDRAIARHLVAHGTFDRFLGEPRGPSDRKRALDAFHGEKLARATRGDADMRRTTASLLRARSLAAGASGDKDAALRTVTDLRRFAPNDATGGEIVKRIVLATGPADVADLRP